MEFKDQYKHPNWQRARLKSLERANFRCQRCQDEDDILHVHHKRYVKGRMIWEYQGAELEVLCESCHKDAHADKETLQALIARLPSNASREIAALIAGYCSGAKHLMSCVEASDAPSDPWMFAIGSLAAAASEAVPDIHSLIAFTEKIGKQPFDNLFDGGEK